MIYPMVPFSVTLNDLRFQSHGVIRPTYFLDVLCARLTRGLFSIAKILSQFVYSGGYRLGMEAWIYETTLSGDTPPPENSWKPVSPNICDHVFDDCWSWLFTTILAPLLLKLEAIEIETIETLVKVKSRNYRAVNLTYYDDSVFVVSMCTSKRVDET